MLPVSLFLLAALLFGATFCVWRVRLVIKGLNDYHTTARRTADKAAEATGIPSQLHIDSVKARMARQTINHLIGWSVVASGCVVLAVGLALVLNYEYGWFAPDATYKVLQLLGEVLALSGLLFATRHVVKDPQLRAALETTIYLAGFFLLLEWLGD